MTEQFAWRPERVRVGTVGKPHGLDGSFRVSDTCGWWDFPLESTVLVNGAVLTEGTPQEIANNPQVKSVYLGHSEELTHG